MATALLNEKQHRRAQRLYLIESRSASDVAAILNAEFGSEGLRPLTPRMITEYASTRKWGSKRKALADKGALRAHQLVASIATAVAKKETASIIQQQEFIDRSARIGGAVLEKAARLIETVNSPRDLASAASAARVGIFMYRQAVGIETAGPGSTVGTTTIWYNFARGPDSPFMKRTSGPETVVTSKSETTCGQDAVDVILND